MCGVWGDVCAGGGSAEGVEAEGVVEFVEGEGERLGLAGLVRGHFLLFRGGIWAWGRPATSSRVGIVLWKVGLLKVQRGTVYIWV